MIARRTAPLRRRSRPPLRPRGQAPPSARRPAPAAAYNKAAPHAHRRWRPTVELSMSAMFCGMRALSPAAATRKPMASPSPTGSTVSIAAARDGLLRDHHHVQQQLDPVFRQQHARQIPRDLGLGVLEVTARHGLRVAEIDLRARRSGRPERQAAELQPRRSGLGALADQIERKFAIFRLRVVVEDLKPIDDGADRTDEIMANPRTQQRRQFEGVGGGTGSRGARHKVFPGEFRDRRGHGESRMLAGLIHCGRACCQHKAAGPERRNCR